MEAEHLSIDDGAEDEEVEDLAARFPDGGVAVLLLAFFVEAVDLGDLAGFMVATDEGDSVGVAKLRGQYRVGQGESEKRSGCRECVRGRYTELSDIIGGSRSPD